MAIVLSILPPCKTSDYFFAIFEPAAPTCGVYISQLIRYSRACGSYQDFLDRGLLLTRMLLNQVFLLVKLKSLLRKFYGLHPELVDRYGISLSQMDMFNLFLLNTYRSFLHSWLITGFITRLYISCSFTCIITKNKIESGWLTPLHFQTYNVTKDFKTVECLEINYQCYFVYKTPVMIRSAYFSLWYKN